MADVLDASLEAASPLTVVIASEISSISGSKRKDGFDRYHWKRWRVRVGVGGNDVQVGVVDCEQSGRLA